MSKKYSWRSFDEEEARKKESDNYIAKATVEEERLGRLQRQIITTELVDPFLAVMRQHGNPGLGWRKVWSDDMPRKLRQTSHAYGTRDFYDIYVTGKWLFGSTAGSSGLRGSQGLPYWVFSSEFKKDERRTVSEYQIKQFQTTLVAILREFDVPLPKDS